MRVIGRAITAFLTTLSLVACDVVQSVVDIVQPPGNCSMARAGDIHDLEIAALHVVQVVQDQHGAVPLVSGRDALVRAFVVHRSPDEPPAGVSVTLTVHVSRGDVVLGSLEATGPSCVVAGIVEDTLTQSHNVLIPSDWITAELTVHATAEVGGGVHVADGNLLRFPREGAMRLPVVEPAPLHITFVPVTYAGLHTDVDDGSAPDYVTRTRELFPLDELDVALRSPYVFGSQPGTVGDISTALLLDMRTLRLLDGSDRHYFGLIEPVPEFAPAGRGFIGLPVSVGIARNPDGSLPVSMIAHELGHNFGLLHAPCGDVDDVDINFPYHAGNIGVYGYDAHDGALVPPHRSDLMSYCHPRWISDYHFLRVQAFRGGAGSASQRAEAGAPGRMLVVSGSMDEMGLHLRPLFVTEALPAPPEPGPYVLHLVDEDGNGLADIDFAMDDVSDHTGREISLFSFTVELQEADLASLTSAEVRHRTAGVLAAAASHGARVMALDDPVSATRSEEYVSLSWDARRFPAILVRDAMSGEVIARGDTGELALSFAGDTLDIVLSDGVRSRTERLEIGPE